MITSVKKMAEILVRMMDERERLDAGINTLKGLISDKVGDGIPVGDRVVIYNEPSTRSNFDKDKLKSILLSEAGLSDTVTDSMFERAYSESDVSGFVSVIRKGKWESWKERRKSLAA